ncbi:MAG: diguanylate cyclase [Proteobacteria bacterium]|nr:diguanylate cyclase [Pseudomonadota bacterium]
MGRSYWLWALLVIFAGWSATAIFEYVDARQRERTQAAATETQLRSAAARIESRLARLLEINRRLVAELGDGFGDRGTASLQHLAEGLAADQKHLVGLSVARKLTTVFVHPRAGNEAALGMNYAIRPEAMVGIQRAINLRGTVITGPMKLVQNGRLGVIVRTPVFAGDTAGGVFLGLVSVVVDLDGLLAESGLRDPSATFALAIRGRESLGARGEPFFGNPDIFRAPHIAVDVRLPDGHWRLAAVPLADPAGEEARRWLIRGIGAALTVLVLLALLFAERPPPRAPVPASRGFWRALSLRTFLAGILLLVVLPIVAISGWLSLQSALRGADRLTDQLAAKVGGRIHDQVVAFFEAPRRVLAFNAEQAGAGLLGHEDRQGMMRRFLLELRQSPWLTFVSIGLADGEYYAGSRPPRGEDRGLRMLHARQADGLAMHIYRVDDANRRGSLLWRGERPFDARTRPWFRSAVAAGSMGWYPVYRYAIDDDNGAYASLGIGMAAPLHDPQGRFIGVATADVALVQLAEFLRELLAGSEGVAFIAESSGELLATSLDVPIHRFDGSRIVRFRAEESAQPLIRAAGAALARTDAPEGRLSLPVDGRPHVLDWRSHALPLGPTLTLAVLLPESRFAAPVGDMLRDSVALLLAALRGSLLVVVLATDWLARPRAARSRWAGRLPAGDWQATAPRRGPVREVAALVDALDDMAGHLKRQTVELEQRVAARTAELEEANRLLAALSLTDGLTGLGNRRRFDAALEIEWARAARLHQPLAILMLDADLFKQYNDRYGHQAGDACLCAIARCLGAAARRASDLAARYGGEEFAIVAPDTDPASARQLAETIRLAVAALDLPHPDSPHARVTVSIGVASLRPAPEHAPGDLLQQADAALYRAKQRGRNCVEA